MYLQPGSAASSCCDSVRGEVRSCVYLAQTNTNFASHQMTFANFQRLILVVVAQNQKSPGPLSP